MNLEEEIETFKEEIRINYLYNPIGFISKELKENYIYLRLSTLDTTIKDKDSRIKDAILKLSADFNKMVEIYPNLKKEGFKLFVEVKSAYKNSTREVFIDLYNNYLFREVKCIKDLLENTYIENQRHLYISSFDRLSRVFFYSMVFQIIRILRCVRIHSLIPEENRLEEENKSIKDEENHKQLLYVFQLMMLSSSASKHSEDMSIKIKKRVTKNKKGVTISSKTGNVWGTTRTISPMMKKRIVEKFRHYTAKEISEQSDIFKKVKGVKKPIKLNTILKIIQEGKK